MKKTTNYQLNQWDAEDRILREDFNQDNKKLDDAIAALRDACPLVKVVDFTTQSTQSKVEISLAGQNMEKMCIRDRMEPMAMITRSASGAPK